MEEEIAVKDGGTKINDFEDLKLAFLALNKAYNNLAVDYTNLKIKLKYNQVI